MPGAVQRPYQAELLRCRVDVRLECGRLVPTRELAVQVDAFTFNVHDRSLLEARGSWPFATIGASRDLNPHWNVGLEVLYVPLRVQRGLDAPTENDSLTSVRLQLLYRFD